jgi:hypothetical protein
MGKKKTIDRTFCWRTFQENKQKAIRVGSWKYLQDKSGNEYLFNLTDDQQEKNDRKAAHKAVFNRLKQIYARWEKDMLSPIPL